MCDCSLICLYDKTDIFMILFLWPHFFFVNWIVWCWLSGKFHLQERLLEAVYKRNISELSSGSFWPSFIFGDTLRIVFQNLLLESNEEILQCSDRVWRLLVQVFFIIIRVHECLTFYYYFSFPVGQLSFSEPCKT